MTEMAHGCTHARMRARTWVLWRIGRQTRACARAHAHSSSFVSAVGGDSQSREGRQCSHNQREGIRICAEERFGKSHESSRLNTDTDRRCAEFCLSCPLLRCLIHCLFTFSFLGELIYFFVCWRKSHHSIWHTDKWSGQTFFLRVPALCLYTCTLPSSLSISLSLTLCTVICFLVSVFEIVCVCVCACTFQVNTRNLMFLNVQIVRERYHGFITRHSSFQFPSWFSHSASLLASSLEGPAYEPAAVDFLPPRDISMRCCDCSFFLTKRLCVKSCMNVWDSVKKGQWWPLGACRATTEDCCPYTDSNRPASSVPPRRAWEDSGKSTFFLD